MQLIFCDDTQTELELLKQCSERYAAKRNVPLQCRYVQSGKELIDIYTPGCCDAVFLDIIMPESNGISVAKAIRNIDKNVKILFLTHSPEFALDSYEVKAFDYILKSKLSERFFEVLDEIAASEPKRTDDLFIKTHTGAARLPFNTISYVEVQQKKLYFHLTDGTVREINASLKEYEDRLLSYYGFQKVHRSYIVNLDSMMELTAKDFITCSPYPIIKFPDGYLTADSFFARLK